MSEQYGIDSCWDSVVQQPNTSELGWEWVDEDTFMTS